MKGNNNSNKESSSDGSRHTSASRQGGEQRPSNDQKMPTSSLSPHTLRLLKLVLEGTAEHAEEASIHLKRMAATCSPTQLWEMMGRLHEGLMSSTWKTRTQAADALQGVSQHLPVTDQLNFMQSTYQDPSAYHYLCLDDLLSHSTLEHVLEKGQALYSTSFERYDDYEQELIDQSAEGESDMTDRNNSIRRRISLQKQIMAERLGLAKITEIIGGDSVLPVDDDVNVFYAEKRSKDFRKQAKRRRMQATDENFSVCDLLVSEMNHTLASNATNNVSHRNPQELLASELVFRMFDSAWYRRHGALLGLISLIRAWRGSYTSESAGFGLWLHDVLSRALCVLGLDRFGDFAGAMIADSECRTGGVVAPVRELVGQLISLLFQLAPIDVKSKILEALQKLARYEVCWEPRQGALTCFKYIVAVLNVCCNDLPENIFRMAVLSLNDDSDDVKGAASQLLLGYMRGVHDSSPLDFSEAFPAVVRSVQIASDVSSSLVDLMELLAVLLEGNALRFVEALSTTCTTMESLDRLARILLLRLDSEFDSIRIASLKAVKALSMVYKTHFSRETSLNAGDDLLVFCQLLKQIFTMFTANRVSAEMDDKVNLIIQKEHVATWELLCDVCRLLKGRCSIHVEKLENELLSLYYWDIGLRLGHCGASLCLCEALSTFVLCTESEKSIYKIEGAIRMFLRSPWIYHFEASCLLYRCLCAKSAVFSEKETNELLCQFLNERPPNCLYVCQNAKLNDVTLERSFLSDCIVAFEDELSLSLQTQNIKIGERFEATWAYELLKRGYAVPIKFSKVPSLLTMRVETSIAGAIIVDSLPTKLTPVIQSLMTSLMNESSQSGDRITLLASDFLALLKKMNQVDHSTPLTKLINKLCRMAASQDQGSNSSPGEVAGHVLRSYAGSLGSIKALLKNPLWPNITGVNTMRDTMPERKRSFSLLRVVCEGIPHSSPLIAYLIESFADSLVDEACVEGNDDNESTTKVAVSILLTLCKLDTTTLLKRVLRLLLPRLSMQSEESRLLSATIVLKNIVESCSADICRFVRVLLPSVMQLMCNSSQACSQMASSIFSNLILNAPFAQSTTTVSFQECGLEPVCENVIDHLIFGLPIPNYELPASVTNELSHNGIVLRDYQKEGISWLKFLQSLRLNGSLCDSMGLGKTLQALIAVALAHYDHREQENETSKGSVKSLIVCPSSVVGHWVNEIQKFFPLRNIFCPMLYAGSLAARRELKSKSFSGYNIIVTSYSVLRSETDTFCERDWIYCVLDEGHLLKNPKTATALASKKLRAQHKIILTGTPVQNNVNEVWAMFDFLMPNYLGSATSFTKTFARPIMKSQLATASTSDVQDGNTRLKLLHQQTLPFILRREKDQVLRELPPKIITVFNVPLSRVQKQLYAEFCSRTDAQEGLESFKKMLLADITEPSKMGSSVLKTILFLRLLCSHPTLVLPEQNTTASVPLYSVGSSGKLQAVQYLLSEAGILSEGSMGADGDYSALYSDFPEEGFDDPANQVAVQSDFIEVSKVERCSETRCLIFAQFTRTLDVVENLLFKRIPSLKYSRIDGKVPSEKRAALAENFNFDKSISVMLLTTRVGSLGLNLTGANMVIILESDFNPFADLQAIDRAHRIGQNDSVRVFKLITKDTIEESIQMIQDQKIKTSNAIVNAGNSTMFQMGTDKLLDLFSTKSSEEVGVELEHIDLDALLAAYSEEYTSLSAHNFTLSLQNSSNLM